MIRRRRAIVAALAALGCSLLVPAFASAAHQVFQVNSVGDEAKAAVGATCETATPGKCTLRAAIEAADVDTNTEPDLITFVQPQFTGNLGDEVILGLALPAITRSVMIVGNSCEVLAVVKPCAGVTAPVGGVALKVEADDVSVIDLALGGGDVGVEVAAGHTGFVAVGDWFGLKLDASADGSGTAGVRLGPGADEATIGGAEESERNVFTHATVGVEIEGASKTKIRGNYLGVGPTGLGAASLEEGVRIFDATGSPAEENEVGGILTSEQVGTTKCDGPCNVIATDLGGQGVNLAGSGTEPAAAATGPTVIRGNYVGLGADGTTAVGESNVGVMAAPSAGGCGAGPANVTVGGTAATEANFIAGGGTGIFAEGAENFSALGNSIGIDAAGAATVSPASADIALCAEGITERAHVAGNKMLLGTDTIGIESVDGRADIIDNAIEGGVIGIAAREGIGGAGDLIQGNTVAGTDRQGILIAANSNVIVGNTVSGSEWSGVQIEEGGEHNRVGGDSAGEANTIDEAGHGNPGSAIVIDGEESSRNEIAANTGFGNAGAFIELEGHGHSEIPNGLKPPTVTSAFQSSATGTAAPGTKVRVFSKAKSEAGELGEYLGSATTDSAGVWKATFAKLPVGTLIAATQTSNPGMPSAGTSEVSAAAAAAVDPSEPEIPSGGGSGGSPPAPGSSNPPPPPPAQAPKVSIASGPKKSSTSTTAKFKFKAEPAAGAKFECKLDGGKWAGCGSPKTYKKLKVGKHTFQVRATAGGLTGAATKFKFTVKA